MVKIRSTTRAKLLTLAQSEERQQLKWLKRHITQPLGDWQCHPNLYVRHRYTAKLTAEIPLITITMPTEVLN